MYASLLVFLGVVLSVALAFRYSGVSSSLKRSSNAIKMTNVDNKLARSTKLMASKGNKLSSGSEKLCMNPSAKGELCDSALCQMTGVCMKGKSLDGKSVEW